MAKIDKPTLSEKALSPKQAAALREQLVEEKKRILDLYSHDLRAGQESHGEESDDIVDRANHAYNRELNFSLSNAEREQLIQIEEALQRIDDGSYGLCLHSGQPIGFERLKAVPWARYKIEYQELAEKGLLEEEGA